MRDPDRAAWLIRELVVELELPGGDYLGAYLMTLADELEALPRRGRIVDSDRGRIVDNLARRPQIVDISSRRRRNGTQPDFPLGNPGVGSTAAGLPEPGRPSRRLQPVR